VTAIGIVSDNLSESTLLLTLGLDTNSLVYFQSLRDKYYPPALNVVPAHVSLFHNLPGAELSRLEQDILAELPNAPFEMRVSKLHFMGKGFFFYLESEALLALQRELSARWDQWLIPQDRQRYKPHIVVQNKTAAERARADFAHMDAQFEPFTVRAESLLLWQYLNGPWRLERAFAFGENTL
jgi:2'-5' RNA ligase